LEVRKRLERTTVSVYLHKDDDLQAVRGQEEAGEDTNSSYLHEDDDLQAVGGQEKAGEDSWQKVHVPISKSGNTNLKNVSLFS
jgi:hypothetical protein